MIKIDAISAKPIADSRGEKTIEINLTSGGYESSASIPCGKSKGLHEVFCHTIERSLEIVKEISPKISSREFSDQKDFDHFLISLDGTENKSNLGVSVCLSLSIAFCRIFAQINKTEVSTVLGNLAEIKEPHFPRLFINLINGGLHADSKLKPPPFQEYLIIPRQTNPKKAIELSLIFIEKLKQNLEDSSREILIGDEGGFVISSDSDPELGLKVLNQVLESNQKFKDIDLGIDAASSSLCEGGDEYRWNEFCWTSAELEKLYLEFAGKYPLLSIEDPFYQEAWKSWTDLKEKIGDRVWLIGDDLTVTNVKRISQAQHESAINAVLIKPNQIGTVSETIEAVKLTKKNGWKVIVSHRSGETMDSFISDLAYAVAADGLKAGSPLQAERLVKYNRLVEIESSLASKSN